MYVSEFNADTLSATLKKRELPEDTHKETMLYYFDLLGAGVSHHNATTMAIEFVEFSEANLVTALEQDEDLKKLKTYAKRRDSAVKHYNEQIAERVPASEATVS